MKKNALLFILVFFILNNGFGQRWIYKKGSDAFDGNYRTAYISGTGDNFPYNNPFFVINYFENNEKVNVYISDVGYAGCDNKIVKIKFNTNDTIYTFSSSTDTNKEIWFLEEYTITIPELLQKLMEYNKINVRVSSDCGVNNLVFSLNGSTNAIKFVLPTNYFEVYNSKQLKLKYDEQIEQAEHYVNIGDYEQAITYCKRASTIMKNKEVPQNKINDILKIIEDKDKEYNKYMTNAESYIQKEQYSFAIDEYVKAIQIFPNREEPKIKKEKLIENRNLFLVKNGTNLYPNPDGSGKAIIHVASKKYILIIDKKLNKDYWYASYGGKKGYISKYAFD